MFNKGFSLQAQWFYSRLTTSIETLTTEVPTSLGEGRKNKNHSSNITFFNLEELHNHLLNVPEVKVCCLYSVDITPLLLSWNFFSTQNKNNVDQKHPITPSKLITNRKA